MTGTATTSYGPNSAKVERALDALKKLTPEQWETVVDTMVTRQQEQMAKQAEETKGMQPPPQPAGPKTDEEKALAETSQNVMKEFMEKVGALMPADLVPETKAVATMNVMQAMILWSTPKGPQSLLISQVFKAGKPFLKELDLPKDPPHRMGDIKTADDLAGLKETLAVFQAAVERISPERWEKFGPSGDEVAAGKSATEIATPGPSDEANWRTMAAVALTRALARGAKGNELDEAFAPFDGLISKSAVGA